MTERRENIKKVRPCDVLLGRGKCVHYHAGNEEYRKLIKSKASDYQKLHSTEKDDVARQVIQTIEARGGRFLRPAMRGSSQWSQCPYYIVRTKVKQALRDVLKTKSPPGRSWHGTKPIPSSKSQKRIQSAKCTEKDAKEETKGTIAARLPSPECMAKPDPHETQTDDGIRDVHEGPSSNTLDRIQETVIGDGRQQPVCSDPSSRDVNACPNSRTGGGGCLLPATAGVQQNIIFPPAHHLPILRFPRSTPDFVVGQRTLPVTGDASFSAGLATSASWLHHNRLLQLQQLARGDPSIPAQNEREIIELLCRLR